MSLLRIVVLGDEDDAILRQRARKVKRFGPHLEKLAQDMIETMRENHGVGLAAPQIGLPLRLFVAEIPEDEEDPQSGQVYVLVNPKIIKASREEVEGEEGCLSVPGIYGDVWRAEEVVVRAQDTSGRGFRLRARGLLARVIQHEVDHLEGILFIDRVEDPTKFRRYVEQDGELVAEPVDIPSELMMPVPARVPM